MKVIVEQVKVLLVLYGGIGIVDEDMCWVIVCGIVKINVNIENMYVWC